MEQKNAQNVENAKTESTEKVETQTTEEKVEKTFTQKEFKEALDKEVARKTRNMPTKEELKAFDEWKESQKTEAEKQNELTQKMNDTNNENSTLKRELAVAKKGIINEDDIDYIVYKVSKMEGDFEDNLKDFLKSNPKFLQKEISVVETQKTTGVAVQKINDNAETGVRAILKAKHPDQFN